MGNVFFGNTNAKGSGGGNGSISFTRTLEATIGYEDKMCMFFAENMGDVEEHADKGNGYFIKINSGNSGTSQQIVYNYLTPSRSDTAISPTSSSYYFSVGGNSWAIESTESYGFVKFTDENNVERYGLNSVYGSYPFHYLSIYIAEKQNLSGEAKSLISKIRAVLMLWDTENNEYVAYDTGDVSYSYGYSINANQYARGGGVQIIFEKKYIICGVDVKYAYYENLNAPSQE